MSNFLEDIFGGPTEVYIAVSANNKLEVGVVDNRTQLLKTYADAFLEYNEATREISDYDIFRAKVEKIFEENGIQPSKCNIHISLPTVWFAYKDNIPITSDAENIKNIVFSELDQTYIFKRTDPVPAWFDAPAALETDTKSIFYTAIQSEALSNLRNMFKEMGANLIEITTSLVSDIKALLSCGFAEEQIHTDQIWSLMIVNNSGFQLYGFKGKSLNEYYEEPIPVKSLDEDEIYLTIDNAAQIALMGSTAQSLILLSETDSVSAKELARKLQFGGQVITIDDNNNRKKPLSDVTRSLIPEQQADVSLHLIGMVPDPSIIPIKINFLLCLEGYSRDDILEIPVSSDTVLVLTKAKAMFYSVVLLLVLTVPLGLATFGIHFLNEKYVSRIEEIETNIKEVNTELQKHSNRTDTSFNPYQEIQNVVKNNRMKVMAYSALGESIPRNLYLTYFMTGDEGYVDIQGYADSVEDVYVFFQNLKDSLLDSKLRLSKLDLKTSSLEDVIENSSNLPTSPYVFEITNMNDGQLAKFMNALKKSSNSADDESKKSSNNAGDESKKSSNNAGDESKKD